MSKVYVFLADGCEEIEALAVIDLLRRAKIETVTVAINDEKLIRGVHNINFFADEIIDSIDINDAELIFLPGGMPGTINLGNCKKLRDYILKFNDENKFIAAICAAPSVLGKLGVLNDKKAVCYPGFEDKLLGAKVIDMPVVTDKNVITSKGMGTAIDLGLKIIEILQGKELADNIEEAIQYNCKI